MTPRLRVFTALLLLGGLLGTALLGESATYYVAKTGNNGNPGTTTQPKLTIAAGAALLAPGDTLLVRPGTYTEQLHNVIPGGTSWSASGKVTVRAETAGTVTIMPAAGSGDLFVLFFHSTASRYIEIDGFILDGDGPGDALYGVLITLGAHHIRIQNTEIKNTLESGILISTGAAAPAEGSTISCCNEFINLHIHHTARTAFVGQSAGGHGIYCATSNNIIERSYFHDNPGYGIHVYNSYGGVNDNIVRYNRVTTSNLIKNAAAVALSSGSRNKAYNNVVYDNGGGFLLNSSNAEVYNNTVVNNTFSPHTDSDIAFIVNVGGSGVQVRNNIIFGHPFNFVCGATNSPTGCGGITTSNNVIVNPSFVNLAAKDFRLTSGSAARNVGATIAMVPDDILGVTRPQGSAYDVGAYEFNESAAPPALSLTIASPTTAATLAVTDPTLASVAGSATGTGFSVTFTCPTCTPSSGSASGTTSWTLPPLTLAVGVNVVTVTATAGATTASDTLTVTYTLPPVATPTAVLALTHTCGTASNVLAAQVLGSLLYLPAERASTALALGQGSCASQVALTDTASVLGGGIPTVAPWTFLGAAGPNTGNSCTNCLAVHNGTPSTNQAGAGYTLPTFREGSTLAAATGGASAFTLMPQLCTQVVAGVVTSTPLWPWAMDARLVTARSLAGQPGVNVTATVAGLLGPIPAACLSTPPVEPSPTTWFVAPVSASPPGVDGAACSITAPCATFAHVATRMASGHTLYLRGGTYAQRITPGLFPSGTSWSAPTTIAAYGTESVTLQLNTGRLLDFAAADRYLVLTGLTIDGSVSTSTSTNGLVVNSGAGPLRFQNGTIRNTHFDRVIITNGVGIEILNSVIHGGTVLPSVRVRENTQGLLLQGNTIHTGPSHGIQLENGTMTNTRLVQNTIQGHPAGTCLLLGVGSSTQVDNNVLAGCAAGLVIEGSATGTQVRYNTIADHSGAGLVIAAGVPGTVVTNTIVARNGTNLTDGGTDTVLTTNLTTDPIFVGGGNYRPASPDSPAVDAGTCLPGVVDVALDGVARPQPAGGACDIGAYEMAGSPVLPTPGALSAAPCCGASHFLVP